MNIQLNKDELFIRELTESESQIIEKTMFATPMIVCPDLGTIKETGDEIRVVHAYNSDKGLHYGFYYSNDKYSSLPAADIELMNPKFNWIYVANQNEKR